MPTGIYKRTPEMNESRRGWKLSNETRSDINVSIDSCINLLCSYLIEKFPFVKEFEYAKIETT